jgi:hypothetical protein
MNKIDKIAKRKELLEDGYSLDFKRSIDENGEIKSEEIWITENKFGFYIQDNEFNRTSERVFDCFNEYHRLKQYKWKRHVIQIGTKEKFETYIYTLKNIAPWQRGKCYEGRKKVIISEDEVKIEVELTSREYSGGSVWFSLDNGWIEEMFKSMDSM